MSTRGVWPSTPKPELPEKTKCKSCHRVKILRLHFSNKQIKDLEWHLQSGKIKSTVHAQGPWLKCKDCTVGGRDELRCGGCDQWKPLDSFSKNQRKEGDGARCLACVAIHENAAPAPRKDEYEALSKNPMPFYDSNSEDDDGDYDSETETTNTNPFASNASGLGPSLPKMDIGGSGLAATQPSMGASYRSSTTMAPSASTQAGTSSLTEANLKQLPAHLRPTANAASTTRSDTSTMAGGSSLAPYPSTFRSKPTQAKSKFATTKEVGRKTQPKDLKEIKERYPDIEGQSGRQLSDTDSDYDEEDGPRM